MPVQTVIKLRRDTAADWNTTDPTLAAGELGIETDTNRIKIGDGATEWSGLKYGPVGDELVIRVKNASNTTAIPAGRLVQFAGAAGDTVTASPAVTNGTVDFHNIIGVTAAEIAAEGFGDVVLTGAITGIATNAYSAGTLLYADPANAGQLTSTAPSAPNFKEPVAAVVRSGAGTSGIILVRLLIGSSLNDIHDVQLATPSSGQVLQYDGTKWVNATVDALPSQTGQNGKYLTTDGTTASWATITIPPGTEVSDTPPSSPSVGQLWWESDTGILYIYYDGFWVEATAGIVGPQGDPGVVQSATAPTDTSLLWIDTTEDGDMVVPAGGTAGQALVKATNTDYDTTWGGPYAASPNYIINGAFDFWQRGTSFSSAGYTADRFAWINGAATGSVSRQTFTPAELQAVGFGDAQFYARWNITSGEQFTTFTQRIEDVRTLAGQTVTVSFWAKGTNPAAGYWAVNLGQDFGSGGSSAVFTATQNLIVTGSWQRYSFTFSVPSVSGKTIGTGSFVRLPNIYQATASSAAFTLDIWGVQVEAGSTATPFRRAANTLQGELAACQRYYQDHVDMPLRGIISGSSAFRLGSTISPEMRVAPSVSFTGSLVVFDGSTTAAISSIGASFMRTDAIELDVGLFSSLVTSRPAMLLSGGGGRIMLSAEL